MLVPIMDFWRLMWLSTHSSRTYRLLSLLLTSLIGERGDAEGLLAYGTQEKVVTAECTFEKFLLLIINLFSIYGF